MLRNGQHQERQTVQQYVQRHPGVTVRELQVHFGYTRAQLESLLADLEENGRLLFEFDECLWDYRKHYYAIDGKE